MMRDCENAEMRDQLPLYVADRLDAPARARIEAHLASCDDCRAEVALLGSVQRAFAAPRIDAARIAAAIPRAGRRAQVPFYRQPLWRVAATLTLFIAGTATVLVTRRGGTGAPPAAADSLAASLAAAPAESSVATPPASTAAPAERKGLVALGTDLSSLSDEQLESLLGSIDGLDSRPQADPSTIAKPIVQQQTQAPGRSNQ